MVYASPAILEHRVWCGVLIWECDWRRGRGISLISVAQILALSLSLTLEVATIDRLNVPRIVLVLTIAFICLFPLFPLFGQYAVKDSLFASVFIAFMSFYALALKNARNENFNWRVLFCLALSAIMCCLLRNNGLYIVLISLPVLAIVTAGSRKVHILLMTAFVIVFALMVARY